MVVEDDIGIREGLTTVLQDEGHHVIECRNGQEALDGLKGPSRPCLILLDLMMPVMNGWQFRVNQLKDGEWSKIPVLLMSAGNHLAKYAQDLLVNGYFRKPIQLHELLDVVGRICRP